MKNITVLILMTFIFFGCKQNSKEKIKNISEIDTTKNEKTIKELTDQIQSVKDLYGAMEREIHSKYATHNLDLKLEFEVFQVKK